MKAVDGFKIWQVNDGDWIWGTQFSLALEGYISQTGISLDEIFGWNDGHINSDQMELDDATVDRLKFKPDSNKSDDSRSFRIELQARANKGEDVGFFASSEY